MFLTMINNNNTDSYTSTTSNKDIVKLVKDVKQNFKDFLEEQFVNIIKLEVDDIKTNFNQEFTAVAYSFPSNSKDVKYNYLCHAISKDRPTMEESYKLIQNFSAYSEEEKWLIDLSCNELALVFTEKFWNDYMKTKSISNVKEAFLCLYSTPIYINDNPKDTITYISFPQKEYLGVAKIINEEIWIIDSCKSLKDFDKNVLYKALHSKANRLLVFDNYNYVVNKNKQQ